MSDLKWTADVPETCASRHLLDLGGASGPVTISVAPHTSAGKIIEGITWHFMSLTVGRILERSQAEGQVEWPREALAEARKILDELERKLN